MGYVQGVNSGRWLAGTGRCRDRVIVALESALEVALRHDAAVKWWFPARYFGIRHKARGSAGWKREQDAR